MIAADANRWPPDRFYWAIVDVSALPRTPSRRKRREQLQFLLERYLPIPLEHVHAVFVDLDGDRVLACAAEREEIEQIAPNTTSVTPEALPEFLGDSVDLRRLNVLTGPFEPRCLRQARSRWRLELAAVTALCASILIVGLTRRAAWHAAQGASALTAQRQLMERVFTDAGLSTQPAALRLTGELRRLEQTRSTPADSAASVVPHFAMLLQRWPSDLPIRTESVVVSDSSLTIRASLESSAQIELLSSALSDCPGWSMTQPEVRTHQGRVQATIRLQRMESTP